MRRWLLALGVVAASVPSWLLLASWTPGGSERFYLLVPPVFLLVYSLVSPGGWRGLLVYARPAVAAVAALGVAYIIYHLHVMTLLAPAGSGRVFRGLSLWEAVVTLYFLGALLLVLAVAWQLLRWLCGCSVGLLFGASVEDQKERPRRRAFVRRVLPVLLLGPLAVPYLASVMYIHRLKLPNVTTPRELLGREYEDVSIITEDGLNLRGWFIPAREPSATRTLLLCHGLGINRSHVLSYQAVGDALGAHVFLFDFRGHGESDGHTVSIGGREKLDVLAAVRYLRQQRPGQARKIVGLGISMGAAALTRATAELQEPLEGLILDSGFAELGELTDQALAWFPAILRPCVAVPALALASLHAGYDLKTVRPIDQVSTVRAPVLFVHAEDDRLVPVEHARRLFRIAAAPKSVWISPTGDHCSAWNARTDYLRALDHLNLGATSNKMAAEPDAPARDG